MNITGKQWRYSQDRTGVHLHLYDPATNVASDPIITAPSLDVLCAFMDSGRRQLTMNNPIKLPTDDGPDVSSASAQQPNPTTTETPTNPPASDPPKSDPKPEPHSEQLKTPQLPSAEQLEGGVQDKFEQGPDDEEPFEVEEPDPKDGDDLTEEELEELEGGDDEKNSLPKPETVKETFTLEDGKSGGDDK